MSPSWSARIARKLSEHGLVVLSLLGDVTVHDPHTVTADGLSAEDDFDLVLLSCKAYDLEGAIDDIVPAVGPKTLILPVLNGLAHLDALDSRFGAEHVLGGCCKLAVTVNSAGAIRHSSDFCTITYGERNGQRSDRLEAADAVMRGGDGTAPKFDAHLSDTILLDMWESGFSPPAWRGPRRLCALRWGTSSRHPAVESS